MGKYIIQNCPGYNYGLCSSPSINEQGCVYCTSCVMKKIVELCKEELNSLETYVDVRSLECVVLQNILKLLDIQEVE